MNRLYLFGLIRCLLIVALFGVFFSIDLLSQTELSAPQACDSDESRTIDDDEIVACVKFWITNQPLPGFDRAITDEEVVDLIRVWVTGELVGPPQMDSPTEFLPEPMGREFSDKEVFRALEYWTPERLAKAEPAMPVPIEELQGRAPKSEAKTPTRQDIPFLSGGSKPADVTDSIFRPSVGPENEASIVNTRLTNYPHRTMGKVFFTDPSDDKDYSCSASVVTTGSNREGTRRAVWTAGHCVHGGGEKGRWFQNWIFIPAYENGNEPLGRWPARELWTLTGGAWFDDRNRNYDLGAAIVTFPDSNTPIGDVTGTLGIMFNFPRNQEFDEFGYPGAGVVYNGQRLVQCADPYSGNGGVAANPGPQTMLNICNFTGGASGGPWLVSLDRCPACYIDSVNSWWWWGKTQDQGLQWAGPYHGNGAQILWNAIRNR